MIEDTVEQVVATELRMVAAAAEEASALEDVPWVVAEIELVAEAANEDFELVPVAGNVVDKGHIQHTVDNVVAGEANLKLAELPERKVED